MLIPQSVPPQKDVFWPTSMTCMCPAATCEASLETSSGEFYWDRSSPAADSWAFSSVCFLWKMHCHLCSFAFMGTVLPPVLHAAVQCWCRCCSCPGGAVAGICSARQCSEGVGRGGRQWCCTALALPCLHFSGFVELICCGVMLICKALVMGCSYSTG